MTEDSTLRTTRSIAARFATVFVFATATLAIVSTWHVFSQAFDEVPHIACGMEWLDRGVFEYEEMTPPLARVAVALGPYLAGVRGSGQESFWNEGNEILHAQDQYWRNLTLARAGELPFLALMAAVVWAWTRRRGGDGGAFAAVLAVLTVPILLAFFGFAVTDAPLAATMVFALWRFERWLDVPDVRRAVWLGVAAMLATITKFSAIVFLVSACGGVILLRWALSRGARAPWARSWRAHVRVLPVVAISALLVVWPAYRFAIDPLIKIPGRPHPGLDHLVGATGSLHDATTWLVERDIYPARAFFYGLAQLSKRNRLGHKVFFDGKIEEGGRFDFYPRMLFIKLPLPFMILVGGAILLLARDPRRRTNWRAWWPLLAAIAVLAVNMMSNLILGVRMVLAAAPPLAVMIGQSIGALPRRARVAHAVVALLLLWQTVDTARAWPDFLPWFNGFAPRETMFFTSGADLDWGQDLHRLTETLRDRQVRHVWLSFSGSADLRRHPLPMWDSLPPNRRVSGYVAISAEHLMAGRWRDRGADALGYRWLLREPLVARVGKSIFLYHVPDSSAAFLSLASAVPATANVGDRE